MTPSSLTLTTGQVRVRGLGYTALAARLPRDTKLEPGQRSRLLCPSECVYSSGHLQLDVLPGLEPLIGQPSHLNLART